MSLGYDPHVFLALMSNFRNEPLHMGKVLWEVPLTDMVIKGSTGNYDPIKCNAECDPDFSIVDMETKMHMYSNRMAPTITTRGSQGRDATMMVASLPNSSYRSSKFRGKMVILWQSIHQLRHRSHGTQSSREERPVKWCSFHHTHAY